VIFVLFVLVQDLSALSSQGASAMRARKFEQAASLYRELTDKDADNPMWRMNLGMALAYGRQHPEAVRELSAFVQVRPQPGPAHFLLGLSLLKMEKSCEATAPLETAQRWAARPNTIWVELGDAYRGCRRWESAAKAYSQAARLTPQDRRLARQMARCWWLARRYDQAKPAYQSIEAAFRSEPEFLFEYGDTLARLEGAAAGLPLLERSVTANPALLAARAALGRAFMDLDQPGEAVPHLEMAAAEDVSVLLPLSKAYRILGRSAEAARVEAEYKAKKNGRE
jgi:tetratricopeptide (TPR) repeat protein